jgi:uncharacterized protein GlcG (DUF336 family)
VVFVLAALAIGLGACQSEEPPPGGECTAGAAALTVPEIRLILGQAVAEASARGLRATVAVVNRQGDFLAVFRMADAVAFTFTDPDLPSRLEGERIPTFLAALSKAGTGAFLSSCGNAFSSRTASFIVQQHFPPKIDFQPGGPLFGVQFSNLPCSDVNLLPLGLAGDPGGLPLYKDGQLAGGIGVEVNGIYGIDEDPAEPDASDRLDEEAIALAGTRGFEAPEEIRADQILVAGIRFPYIDAEMPEARAPANLPADNFVIAPNPGGPSKLMPAIVRGIRVDDEDVDQQLDCPDMIEGQSLVGRFPPVDAPGGLRAEEVRTILGQAACRAVTARAAIRRPLGSSVQVNITVVDREGRIQGMFRTLDAPIFGADVSAQKARTAAFMSHPLAGLRLRAAGLDRYVDAAAAESVEIEGRGSARLRFDGTVAFSDRGNGFLSRPFFPDGINDTAHGPLSLPPGEWSPLNTGLQLDAVAPVLLQIVEDFRLTGGSPLLGAGCGGGALAGVDNGFQIFAGSVPLYRGNTLIGGIGVSGDGIDQDDLVSLAGSIGFEAPPEMRSDRVIVIRNEENGQRRTRLPYVKLPRNPNLGE